MGFGRSVSLFNFCARFIKALAPGEVETSSSGWTARGSTPSKQALVLGKQACRGPAGSFLPCHAAGLHARSRCARRKQWPRAYLQAGLPMHASTPCMRTQTHLRIRACTRPRHACARYTHECTRMHTRMLASLLRSLHRSRIIQGAWGGAQASCSYSVAGISQTSPSRLSQVGSVLFNTARREPAHRPTGPAQHTACLACCLAPATPRLHARWFEQPLLLCFNKTATQHRCCNPLRS